MSNQRRSTERLDVEAAVGRKVRALREAKGLSQAQLGQHMAELGYPMEQPTVYKLERGARPLRLNEVVALASVLGTSVEELTRTEEDRDRAASLQEVMQTARQVGILEDQQRDLRMRLDRLRAEAAQMEATLDSVNRDLRHANNAHVEAVERMAVLQRKAARGG